MRTPGRSALLAALLFIAPIPWTVGGQTAFAGPLVIEPVAAGTIEDGAPWPTSFLYFYTKNDRATVALEFDIGALSGEIPVTTLGLGMRNHSAVEVPAIEVYTYRGDGVVTLGDASSGDLFAVLGFREGADVLSLDVTAAVQAAVDARARYLGFRLSTPSGSFDIWNSGDTPYQRPVLTVGGATSFVPRCVAIQPGEAVAGSRRALLRVEGRNLSAHATVRWNGSDRPTRVELPDYYLEADISASDLAEPGTAEVTIHNPDPGGGTSNPLTIRILAGLNLYVEDDALSDPGPGDPNVSDPLEDGSPEHPFDRIQEAADRARKQDVVHVGPGTYQEDLVVRGSGLTLQGSGRDRTHLRPSSAAILDAAGSLPQGRVDVALYDLDLSGGNVRAEYFGNVILEDVSISKGNVELALTDFSLGSIQSVFHVEIVDATISEGRISASGRSAPYLIANVHALSAPGTVLELFSGGPEGFAQVDVSDSTLGGLSFRGYESDWTLNVADTRFTGSGLDISFDRDASYQQGLIERAIFEEGGINFQHLGGRCRCSGARVVVNESEFRQRGIDYDTGYGGPDDTPVFYLLDVDANRFDASGVDVRIHNEDGRATNTTVRLRNNLFAPVGSGLSLHHIYPPNAFEGAGNHQRLEVVNNTFAGADTGIRVVTDDHETGLDELASVVENNILVGGGKGIEILGTDDQQLTIRGNDVFDNTTADYAGDLPDQTGTNGNISSDPLFAAAASGDYDLTLGSPCVDAGVSGAEVPATDHDGVSRPQDGDGDGVARPDIGAHELVPRDADGDGFVAGPDCNDSNPAVHPGAIDLPGDSLDEDCDGTPACDPGGAWRNHGQFVSCVERQCGALAREGAVSKRQCSALVSQAGRSAAGGKEH